MKKTTTIRRVDEGVLQTVLENSRGTVTEVILRLAWGAGLIPEEMHRLTWDDVDFSAGELCLPDRSVPVDGETMACLQAWYKSFSEKRPEYVVVSEGRKVHMNRVYIFRCAREALNRGGLSGVTLMNLRQDFILRQLQRHSKAYVARIAGVTVATLEATFVKQVARTYEEDEAGAAQTDFSRVFEAALQERGSPVGVAIWLAWKCGLKCKEIISLTWEDVDLDAGTIRLEDREILVDGTLRDWLVRSRAEGAENPHVVLTPQSRRPYDGPRLSRAVKNALIRAGLEQMTLRDLSLRGQHEQKEALLLRHAEERGFVTREETADFLQVGWRPAWDILHRLVKEEKLMRIGARYYPAGAAVPPERHYEVVRAYLETEGGAYRKELADLLRIGEKQCSWILSGLVAEGKLNRKGQRYILPEDEAVYQLK